MAYSWLEPTDAPYLGEQPQDAKPCREGMRHVFDVATTKHENGSAVRYVASEDQSFDTGLRAFVCRNCGRVAATETRDVRQSSRAGLKLTKRDRETVAPRPFYADVKLIARAFSASSCKDCEQARAKRAELERAGFGIVLPFSFESSEATRATLARLAARDAEALANFRRPYSVAA